MDFGDAMLSLKSGRRVTRYGWNGKGMWLVMMEGASFHILAASIDADQTAGNQPTPIIRVDMQRFIAMRTAEGCFIPWVASQSDILAEDWDLAK